MHTPIPKIPRRQEFYAALFAVNLFLFGSYSGHMGFDFVSAIRRMAGHSRFKYKTLFKGDNFDLGTTSFSCLWPPRDLRSERLERRIGAAIAPFKKALEEHPGLNKLHDEVRDSKWFGKLLDGEENGLPPDVNTDEKSLSLEEQSFHGDLKIANSKLRGVANDLCLAFHHENQLLFLGDLSNGSLLELVKDLQAQSLINFRTLVAPHHGSIWEDCLTKLRAGHILVSNGPRLSPKFKSELNLIGSEVLSTHEKGDILADF